MSAGLPKQQQNTVYHLLLVVPFILQLYMSKYIHILYNSILTVVILVLLLARFRICAPLSSKVILKRTLSQIASGLQKP